MHDGAYVTLEAAVRHELDPIGSATSYEPELLADDVEPLYRGFQTESIADAQFADDVALVILDDDDFTDLIAFLQSLTSPSISEMSVNDTPASVPSGLPLAD